MLSRANAQCTYCTGQGASRHSNQAAGWWRWWRRRRRRRRRRRWPRWPRWCVVVFVVVVVVEVVVEVVLLLLPRLQNLFWQMDDDESGTLTAEEMQQLVKDGVEVLMIFDGRMGVVTYRSAHWTCQWSQWRCRKWQRMSLSGPKDGSILHCFGRCAYFSQWNRIATVKMSDQTR